MSDYKPVDCDLHSTYELAIMKGHPVILNWVSSLDPERAHTKRLWLKDIKVRKHEEILIAELDTGNQIEIRLDYILSMKT